MEHNRLKSNFRSHPGALLPWAAALLTVLSLIVCVVISLLYGIDTGAQINTFGFALIALSGVVIMKKQPENRVSWVLYLTGMNYVLAELFFVYATFTLITRPGALPFGSFISWLAAFTWPLGYLPTIATFLLFPNGQPISPRWWWVSKIAMLFIIPMSAVNAVLLWPYRGVTIVQNNGDISKIPEVGPLIIKIFSVLQPAITVVLFAAVISMFVRFRRARGIERQQLKWILFAAALVPVTILLNLPTSGSDQPWLVFIGQAINLLSVIGFPLAFVFAVTRYRLYEIDVIIRRTLVYSILTLILAGLYFGSVLVLQEVFVVITGQNSPVSIVLSTLLIAAVFSSLRLRIQRIIDRRFYRSRYNAEKMLEAFSSFQRESVELEELEKHLLQAVDQTLQPESVTLLLVKR